MDKPGRRKLSLEQELLLATAPTLTVLLVLWLVEALSAQRLLFSSLASSAFLIYLDPDHPINSARTLTVAQLTAAVAGVLMLFAIGPGYASAGAAMVLAIAFMVASDTVHPPAVSTGMSFGLASGGPSNLSLFVLALSVTVALLGIQRLTIWMLRRFKD